MNDAPFDAPAGPIVKFTPAARKGSHVLIGLYGFSGCGKTLSALYIARGLVGPKGRIAMIDTETGRGLVYAMEAGGFDHAELTPPFTPERYVEAIRQAESAGYDALIIDSASHEWEGIGGIIETADAATDSQGRPLQGLLKWANPKARHKKFVQHLLNTRMHVVICLRAKEKMVPVTAANIAKYPGAKIKDIVSEGMVSIQDKRFIYEQTVQLFLPLPEAGQPRGVPVLEKCPKDLLGAFPPGEQISIATGERIAEWVAGGAPVDHAAEALQRAAEETAAGGTAMMREWWKGLTKDQQKKLSPALPNLRSIAETADKDAERLKAETHDDDDDRLADPFGDHGSAPQGGPTSPPAATEPLTAAAPATIDSPVAQPVERPTLDREVAGSTPAGAAITLVYSNGERQEYADTKDDAEAYMAALKTACEGDKLTWALNVATTRAVAKRYGLMGSAKALNTKYGEAGG